MKADRRVILEKRHSTTADWKKNNGIDKIKDLLLKDLIKERENFFFTVVSGNCFNWVFPNWIVKNLWNLWNTIFNIYPFQHD